MANLPNSDSWIMAMSRAAGCFGISTDINALRQQMRWYESLPLPRRLERLSSLMGMQVKIQTATSVRWRNEILPVMAQLQDGSLIVLE